MGKSILDLGLKKFSKEDAVKKDLQMLTALEESYKTTKEIFFISQIREVENRIASIRNCSLC